MKWGHQSHQSENLPNPFLYDPITGSTTPGQIGVMAMKRYSTFPKAPGLLWESYPSAEMKLVYSAAPANWAKTNFLSDWLSVSALYFHWVKLG